MSTLTRLQRLLRRGALAPTDAYAPTEVQPSTDVWHPQREFAHLSKALLRTTAEVIHSEMEADAVVLRYCQALVQASERLPLAWSWFGPADTTLIQPQVCAGRATAWGERQVIERNWLTNIGPAFGALAGRGSAPFSVSRLSPYGPWREAARQWGIRSVLCLPLRSGAERESGVFVVYADQPDYFDPAMVEFFESIGEMFGSILARASTNRELRKAVMTDALTGLGNRHAVERLSQEIGRRESTQADTVIALIDLDRFKAVNDQHGHDVGDLVLKGAAAALSRAVRQMDEVMRYGGEEFLVCLRGTSLERGAELAQALCDALRRVPHRLPGGQVLTVSGSIGVASLEVGETLEEAITRADQALYAAKRAGRDRICRAMPRLHEPRAA